MGIFCVPRPTGQGVSNPFENQILAVLGLHPLHGLVVTDVRLLKERVGVPNMSSVSSL